MTKTRRHEAEHDYRGVLSVLDDYYDGLWRCDTELLRQVFFPGALYATLRAGELVQLTMDEYLPLVAERTPPAEAGVPREYRVESIEFAGPHTALARLRCSLFGNDYVDFLSLIRVGGSWRIQSKVFHEEPRPQAQEA